MSAGPGNQAGTEDPKGLVLNAVPDRMEIVQASLDQLRGDVVLIHANIVLLFRDPTLESGSCHRERAFGL